MPECQTTIHFDVGYDIYPKNGAALTRFAAEPGVLIATGEGSPLHLGPTLGLRGGGMSVDWEEGGMDEWQLNPSLRMRAWASDWLTIEGSLGPIIALGADGTRPGVGLSFGPGLHGVLDVEGGVELVSGDQGLEPRYVVGFNITIGMATVVAIAMACIYGGC
jgi:hypothetical protein